MKKHLKMLRINSNWTAIPAVNQRRHYRISGRFYKDKALWIELMAVCDRTVTVKQEAGPFLKEPIWHPGWI